MAHPQFYTSKENENRVKYQFPIDFRTLGQFDETNFQILTLVTQKKLLDRKPILVSQH